MQNDQNSPLTRRFGDHWDLLKKIDQNFLIVIFDHFPFWSN